MKPPMVLTLCCTLTTLLGSCAFLTMEDRRPLMQFAYSHLQPVTIRFFLEGVEQNPIVLDARDPVLAAGARFLPAGARVCVIPARGTTPGWRFTVQAVRRVGSAHHFLVEAEGLPATVTAFESDPLNEATSTTVCP